MRGSKGVEDADRAGAGLRDACRLPNARTDWNLEALVPIADLRQPMFVPANSEADIREAVAFADRAGIRIVITGALEVAAGGAAAQGEEHPGDPRLGADAAGARGRASCGHLSARPASSPRPASCSHSAPAAAATARLMPYEAAISVAWGLDRDRALRAITLDAAEILGVADRVGSARAGKIANLFIAHGDPMELRTQFTHVFINGKSRARQQTHRAQRTLLITARDRRSESHRSTPCMQTPRLGLSCCRRPRDAISAQHRSALQSTRSTVRASSRSRPTDRSGTDRDPRRSDHRGGRVTCRAAGRDHDRRQGHDGVPGPDRHGQHRRSRDAGDRREPENPQTTEELERVKRETPAARADARRRSRESRRHRRWRSAAAAGHHRGARDAGQAT